MRASGIAGRRSLLPPAAALLLAAPVAAQSPRDLQVAAAVETIAAATVRNGLAVGMTVAVVRGRDTLVLQGYGRPDRRKRARTPPDAVYAIGSVTKQFTAAAILQLADAGRLSLDDELTRHLPDYPAQGRSVTLRQLLDHTSGIPGYTELPGFSRLMRRSPTPDALVALFAGKPFAFAPGEAMVYSNSGYILLGQVVERVTGLPYAEYVRRHLLEPAGMRSSHYCGEPTGAKLARGYWPRLVPGGTSRSYSWSLRPIPGFRYDWAHSAGALCSTAGDLVAWNRALHGGTLLSPAAYRELVTPGALADGTRLRYAKGIVADSVLGRRALYHGGSVPGFHSELRYFPDDSLTIAILINTSGTVQPDAVAEAIARAIFDGGPEDAPPFPGRPEEYTGEYRGKGRTGPVTLRIGAGRTPRGLTIRTGRGGTAPIRYLGAETFGSGDWRYTFVRSGGRVTAVRADHPYESIVLERKR